MIRDVLKPTKNTPTEKPTGNRPRRTEEPYVPVSQLRTGKRRSALKAARNVGFLLVIALVALYLVPWQQTVVGAGQVTVYDAMSRPQMVQAQISGRITNWYVQEGDMVKKGQLLATLQDIDPKFLDERQRQRLEQQREFTLDAQNETRQRILDLSNQRSQLSSAATAAIEAARQGVEQSLESQKNAALAVRQAEQGLQIARKVANRTAQERIVQTEYKVNQAQQDLVAAKEKENTMRLRKERIEFLRKEGLRSGQELELANNDYVRAEADRKLAEKTLDIAERELKVAGLAEDQTAIEIQTAKANVERARADLAIADREVINARLKVNQVIAETQAGMSRVSADMQSARESVAKTSGDVQKIDVELASVGVRTGQREIRAPATGRVSRLLRVGESASVKAGDELAVIVPETNDRIVELFVSDNDVVLLDVGRPVRLQFAGWPALQFYGWPSVAVGSFGGKIKMIDPVDDGTSRYRVLVEQDVQTLVGGRKDDPWPSQDRLRPGAEAAGWILLDTVPLGFELWRQFNGFPPRVRTTPPLMGRKLSDVGEKPDPKLGTIKLKSK